MSDTENTSTSTFLMIDRVQMRRFGISDLVRNNGYRFRAKWIVRGTGGEVYASSVVDTEAKARELAHKWLAKHPSYVDTTSPGR